MCGQNRCGSDTLLAPLLERVAFDAPVHRVADLERLPATGWMNIKPSRFGTVAELVRRGELPAILVLDRRSPVCEAVVDVLDRLYR